MEFIINAKGQNENTLKKVVIKNIDTNLIYEENWTDVESTNIVICKSAAQNYVIGRWKIWVEDNNGNMSETREIEITEENIHYPEIESVTYALNKYGVSACQITFNIKFKCITKSVKSIECQNIMTGNAAKGDVVEEIGEGEYTSSIKSKVTSDDYIKGTWLIRIIDASGNYSNTYPITVNI